MPSKKLVNYLGSETNLLVIMASDRWVEVESCFHWLSVIFVKTKPSESWLLFPFITDPWPALSPVAKLQGSHSS